MALASGARLGPYEIVSAIGSGGMGEVYRARDTRLGRDVAMKFIHADWARDRERLARFEHEARATAALNHPHIVTVFDVGESEHGPFLVSELLEGETLRVRMTRGRGPLRQSLELAAQIARGLAAAHEKGIVHRDLKPDNVFVTKEGIAKILDFGIAKLRDAHLTPAVTRTVDAVKTAPGMVLGTIGYMAPEQVRGEESDHRADIFALGCITYELVAGKRPFDASSSVDTMHAILHAEPPDLTHADPQVSLAVERVVRRTLHKDPAQRFQSARDLGFAFETIN